MSLGVGGVQEIAQIKQILGFAGVVKVAEIRQKPARLSSKPSSTVGLGRWSCRIG
jgi:hypothetical protein